MSEGGKEAIRADEEVVPASKPASSRTASASSNVFWVARPWRSRSSRRLSTSHGQKNKAQRHQGRNSPSWGKHT